MTRHKIAVYALRLAAIVIVGGVWLYASGPGDVAELILPAPVDAGRALGSLLGSSDLWSGLGITIAEMVVAAAAASVLGIAYGFWGARGPLRRSVLESLASWGYMTPFVLFYPLFILIFGIGPSSKILFAFVASFFPIAYASIRAFAAVDATYLRMGRAFGGAPGQIDVMIKIPAGLPLVRAGLRIGIATSLIMVILGEMLGSTEGLGYMVAETSQTFATAQAYALIICILVIALLLQIALAKTLTTRRERSTGSTTT